MALLPEHVAARVGLPADYSAATEVAAIQKAVFPEFRDEGFRSKGRTFFRVRADGLVQVVDFFTMPVTSSAYGEFAVEIGVYIPEVYEVQHQAAVPKTFKGYHCVFRDRVKPPGNARVSSVEWEALVSPELIETIREKVAAEAFAYFDRFSDRDSILTELGDADRVPGCLTPAPIVAAIIQRNRKETEAAKSRLESYLLSVQARHPMHADYVRGLIDRLFPKSGVG